MLPMRPFPSSLRAASILALAAALAHGGEQAPTGITFLNESRQTWHFTVSGTGAGGRELAYQTRPDAEDAWEDSRPLHGASKVALAAGEELQLLCGTGESKLEMARITFHFRDAAEEMEMDVAMEADQGCYRLTQGKTLDLQGRFDEKASVEERGITFLDPDPIPAVERQSTLVRSGAMGPLVLGRLLMPGAAILIVGGDLLGDLLVRAGTAPAGPES